MRIDDFLAQYPGLFVSFGTEASDVYQTGPGFHRPIQALVEWLTEPDAPVVLWCDVLNYDCEVIAEWYPSGEVVR
ncbi:MAG: hypothetical protein M9928_21840 [Anaerolineae bacterium]|nr:hypothetical protein [Anaerolineae bacterium]MCO5191441.1 hypothetical protein [Anaerolineae bacterium]MCO5195467.1 hypothetical protein [Anaerolineae bacterium]MCO5207658.1 hypothetical protein [Anaerolineae bacterium]